MLNNKDNKFKILRDIKIFILELESLLKVFPKKDIFTKNMVYRDSLDILELILKANYETRPDIKKTYQIDAIAKINKVDFYLERAFILKYINEKQSLKASNRLKELNKMIYTWSQNNA